MKGSVQLFGSLLVSDEPRVAAQTSYPHVIYYDPFSPASVMFTDSDTSQRIQEVSHTSNIASTPPSVPIFKATLGYKQWNRMWSVI